jgi:hypothetical protein
MRRVKSILAVAVALSLLSACQNPPNLGAAPAGGTADCKLFFDNTNGQAVNNGAPRPSFVLTNKDPSLLCGVYTYHWNGGLGARPVGTIGLLNTTTGVMYGPFQAVGSPGQGGAPNVNWEHDLNPRIELKPGTYEVVDSNPPTWSWNKSSGAGFAKVWLKDAL